MWHRSSSQFFSPFGFFFQLQTRIILNPRVNTDRPILRAIVVQTAAIEVRVIEGSVEPLLLFWLFEKLFQKLVVF